MSVCVCGGGVTSNSIKINQADCGGGMYFLDNSTLILYLEVIREVRFSFLPPPPSHTQSYFCDWESPCGITSVEIVICFTPLSATAWLAERGCDRGRGWAGPGRGGLRELLHQHVCSNVIARPRRIKKTQPALQQTIPVRPREGPAGGWKWGQGVGGWSGQSLSAVIMLLPTWWWDYCKSKFRHMWTRVRAAEAVTFARQQDYWDLKPWYLARPSCQAPLQRVFSRS